jgi:hypothetical protein
MVTTSGPLVAAVGTGVTICVLLQLVGVAVAPLNVTVLEPCVAPKPEPVMVTDPPTVLDMGEAAVITGVTENVIPGLATPPIVTTTEPVVAAAGTGTTIFVLLQLVGVVATPLKVTVLLPCALPSVVPVIVTEVPTGPELGLIPVMPNTTVNATPLLGRLPTVTTTLPETALFGTETVMLVSLQDVGVAGTAPKSTVLLPCEAPKLVPVIVTDVPIAPEARDRLVISGVTIKSPELVTPLTVTTTLMSPAGIPAGTEATILVLLQLMGVTVVPLKVSVLVPCVEPKFVPLMVTLVPTGPCCGETEIWEIAVNVTPLLATLPTVTSSVPAPGARLGTDALIDVLLQLLGVMVKPFHCTTLVPCVDPKFVPVMVIGVPNGPKVGETDEMLGPVELTVKGSRLLGAPPTVTTIFPLVAPLGTGTDMLVLLQLMGVAAVPLKVTVLVPCVAPKLAPFKSTTAPTTPAPGENVLITGAPLTVNSTPLLDKLFVTTTFPVVVPVGTGATICVSLQLVGVADFDPKKIVLEPCVAPKPVPVIVTGAPIVPSVGDKLLIAGVMPKTAEFTTPSTVTKRF